MEFRPTAEQAGFASSLGELLRASDSVTAARAWAAGDHAPGLALWKRVADQGVSALMVPESAEGLGATPTDLCVAFEALGHHLAVGPWIESAAFLPAALARRDAPAQTDALAALAGGAIGTLALPPLVPLALDADIADQVYAVHGEALVAAEHTESHRSVDRTRHLFSLTLTGPIAQAAEPGSFDPVFDPTFEAAFDLAALACAAELLGCGERLLADSVDYVKQRQQYGRTIGSYQAIKHQLADVRIALDFARPLVLGASVNLGARSVSAAKVAAADAAYLSSRVALQVHGAIGYTAEFDLGLWINRVRALVGAWGDPSYHRGRIAHSLVSSRVVGGS